MTFHDLDEIYRDKERVLDAIEKTFLPLTVDQLSFRRDIRTMRGTESITIFCEGVQ